MDADRPAREEPGAARHRGAIAGADVPPIELRNRLGLRRAVDGDNRRVRRHGGNPVQHLRKDRRPSGVDAAKRAELPAMSNGVIDELRNERRRGHGAGRPHGADLRVDRRRIDRARRPEIGIGNDARHAGGEVRQQKNRQSPQVGFPGRELEALDERPVLRDQEPVGADGGLGFARRSAREGDDRRRAGIAGLDAAGPIRDAPRDRRGARHTAADGGLDGNGANPRGGQAKPVSPGHGDEGVGADAGDAAIQPLAPGRWIDEHRRRPQPEQRDHRRVERDRHRAEDERPHARPDAGARQIAGRRSGGAIELAEGDAAPPLDDGVTIADAPGLLLENLGDVHSCLEKSA